MRPSHLVQLRPQIHFAEFWLSPSQLFQAAQNGISETGVCEIALRGGATRLQGMPADTGGGSRFAPLMQSDAP